MVGIVLVSHSAALAEGVAELARAMAGDVAVEAAGGDDLAQGFLEPGGAPGRRVVAADGGERGLLGAGEGLGMFEQRPAGVFEPARQLLAVGQATQLLPDLATDRVHGLVGQRYQVKRVGADRG
ncbi:MAG: hypothetical protein M3229_04995, partial [Actinomycetota bacterium]|nr:hypothetical protein [Actinomycetota bacterium]